MDSLPILGLATLIQEQGVTTLGALKFFKTGPTEIEELKLEL
jgi:hypothetical protein